MIEIHTDGGCEPNPGDGGWAFVVYYNRLEMSHGKGGKPNTTNNIMEMTAVLEALRYCIDNRIRPSSVTIFSDSKYTVTGLNEWRHGWAKKGWSRGKKPLANKALWMELAALHDVSPAKIEWVRGHNGTVGNERADELASEGLMDAQFQPDMVLLEQQLSETFSPSQPESAA